MIRKNISKLLIACTLLMSGCASTIRFGTAPDGGVYNEFGELLANDINELDDNYEIVVRQTAGSAANIRLLSEGYIRVGIAQADLVNAMYYGNYDSDKTYNGYSAVTALYTEAVQIAVKSTSDITSVDHLDGAKISIGQDDSGTQRNALQILSAFGIDENMITTYTYNYEDAMNALLGDEIDAMFVTAGTPISIYENNSDAIRILSLEDTKRERMMNNYPFFTEVEIAPGTYTNQSETIYTVGISSVLLASDDAPADSIEEMTQMYFENVDVYSDTLGITFISDPEESLKHIPIPLHEGAKAYYEKCNIDVEGYPS